VRRAQKVRVVVVGSSNFDIVVKAERLPKEGESLLVKNLQFFPGGKGANQAVAAARMGARVSLVGAVGQDVIGDFLIHGLQAGLPDKALFRARDRLRLHHGLPQWK
jgi:ribokinase